MIVTCPHCRSQVEENIVRHCDSCHQYMDAIPFPDGWTIADGLRYVMDSFKAMRIFG